MIIIRRKLYINKFTNKNARRKTDLTQEQLAELLICSSNFIIRIKTERITIHLEKLFKIPEVLIVEPENLLYDFLSKLSYILIHLFRRIQ